MAGSLAACIVWRRRKRQVSSAGKNGRGETRIITVNPAYVSSVTRLDGGHPRPPPPRRSTTNVSAHMQMGDQDGTYEVPVPGPTNVTLDDDRYVATASSREGEYEVPTRAGESATTYSVFQTHPSTYSSIDLTGRSGPASNSLPAASSRNRAYDLPPHSSASARNGFYSPHSTGPLTNSDA